MAIISVEKPDGEVVQVEIAGDTPTAEESAAIARTFGIGQPQPAERAPMTVAGMDVGEETGRALRVPASFAQEVAPNLLGAPMDLVDFFATTNPVAALTDLVGLTDTPERPDLDLVGGSEWWKRRLGDLGLYGQVIPETAPERVASRAGEEVGVALMPLAGLLQGGRAALAGARQAPGAINALVGSTRAAPGTVSALETASAAAAGTGAGTAAEAFPDSPVAEAYGALAGALAPSAAWEALRRAPGVVKSAVQSVTGGPPRQQVGQRLVEAASDPEAAMRALETRQVIPQDFQPTTAQVADDPGLKTFERGQAAASSEAAARALQVQAAQNAAMRRQRELLTPSQAPEAAEEFFRGRLNALKSQVRDRVKAAERLERQAVETLGPRGGRGAESVALRDELEAAMRDARAMESEMWSAVDPGGQMRFDTAPLKTSVERWFEKLPSAYQAFVPRRVMRVVEGLRPEEGIEDLTALRSVIASQARSARRQGNYNEARVLRQLDKRVLRSIDRLPFVSDEYDAARNFSRFLNETFNDGVVKKMLREGVEPETAAALAYRAGEPGGVGTRQVQEALTFQQPGMEPPTPEAGMRAMQEYARRDLAGAGITSGGRVSPEGVERYLQRYGPAMQQMPEVAQTGRRAATQARSAERLAGVAQRGEQALGRTAQARAVAKGIVPEIRSALGSARAGKRLGALVRSARKDQTGAALEGLRRGVWDELTRRLDLGQTDVDKTPLMSPANFRKALTDNRDAMLSSGLYSKTELRRMDRFLGLLEKMNAVQNAKAIRAGPGTAQELASRRQAPTFSLPQAMGRMYNVEKGVVSQRFVLMELAARTLHRMFSGLSDEAIASLTQDALYDPKLASTLMREVTTPKQRAEVVRALRLHLLNEGYIPGQE